MTVYPAELTAEAGVGSLVCRRVPASKGRFELVSASGSAVRMLELSAKAGPDIRALVPAWAGEPLERAIRAALKRGEAKARFAPDGSKSGNEVMIEAAPLDDVVIVAVMQRPALRATDNEQRFRDFAESCSDWFWECDEHMRVTYMSPRFYEATGLTEDQVVGKTRRELGFHALDESSSAQRWEAEADQAPIRNFLSWADTPKGTRIYTKVSGKPVFDAQGQFRGYRGSTTEITDENELKRSLKQIENRFRDFAEASSDWFWETGPDLAFRYVSNRIAEHINLQPQDLRHLGLADLQPADVRKSDWQAHLSLLDERQPFRGFMFTVPKPEGGDDWCEISGKPYFDDDGQFLGYRGAGSNVTARIRNEERIRRYADIVEATDDAVISCDREGRILSWNRSAARMFGIEARDIVGRHVSALGESVAQADQIESLVGRVKTGETVSLPRLPVTPHTGERFWISLTLSPVSDDDGSVIAVVAIARDISDAVKTERLRRQDQEHIRLITDAVPAVIAYLDRDLVYTFANETTLKWAAKPREAILGRSIKELLEPELFARIEPDLERALNGEVVELHDERRFPDGEWRSVTSTYIPDIASDGTVRGFFVMVVDVSALAMAEAAARESRLHMNQIANAVPAAIGRLDSELRFNFINQTAKDWYASEEYPLIGQTYGEAFPPEIAARVLPFAEQALAGEHVEFQTSRVTEDGVQRDLVISMTPDLLPDGSIDGVFLLATDVSRQKEAETKAKEAAKQMRLITDAMPALIAYCDRDYRYHFANKTAVRYYDRPIEEIEGKDAYELLGDAAVQKLKPYVDRVFNGEEVTFESARQFPDGRFRHHQTTYVPDFDESGDVKGMFLLLVDVTTRKAAEAAAERISEQLRLVMDAMPAMVSYCDPNSRYLVVNRTFAEWSGKSPDEMLGLTPKEIFGAEAFEDMKPHIAEVLDGRSVNYEVERDYPDGARRMIDVTLVPDKRKQSNVAGYFVLGVDVTERKRQENELLVLATTDPLTGVSNRRRFLEVAAEEVVRARRSGRPLYVVMCDIDHFKSVNDTHGHDAGDKVLVAFAEICRQSVRGSIDRVGRLGGEEFALLLPETNCEGALVVAERLRRQCESMMVDVDGKSLSVTCSMGVARWTTEAKGIDTTLNLADAALYDAKNGGRNRVVLADPEHAPNDGEAKASTAA